MGPQAWRTIGAAAFLVATQAGGARADMAAVPAIVALGVDGGLLLAGLLLLAVIGLGFILTLRRTPQALVRSIESYRESLRRRGAPPVMEARPGDWLLTGTDRQGRPIRLVVAQSALAREDQGAVIGRNRRIADVVLSDASVSRRHARLVRRDGGLAVIDLKSKRGTWVGGTRLKPYDAPTPLEADDVIRLGTVTLRVGRA